MFNFVGRPLIIVWALRLTFSLSHIDTFLRKVAELKESGGRSTLAFVYPLIIKHHGECIRVY